MLTPFQLSELWLPTLAIFAFIFLVSLRVTGSLVWSAFLAIIKAGMYFIYYNMLFDGTYTIIDDIVYIKRGIGLHNIGIGLTNFYDNIPMLSSITSSLNLYYNLYNSTAVGWFGEGYYAPVAVNVMSTAITALLSTRIAIAEKLCEQRHSIIFFSFALLYPNIVVWSTVINAKDILALLMNVTILYAVSELLHGRRLKPIVLIIAAFVVLLNVRFYLPIMFVVVMMLNAFNKSHKMLFLYLLVSLIVLVSILQSYNAALFIGIFHAVLTKLENPIIGVVNLILLPIPFKIPTAYSFLNLSAIERWLMMPALLLGFMRIYMLHTAFSRFLLIYFSVFMLTYATYGEIQGPRQVMQLDFVSIAAQFTGAIFIIRIFRIARSSPELKPM